MKHPAVTRHAVEAVSSSSGRPAVPPVVTGRSLDWIPPTLLALGVPVACVLSAVRLWVFGSHQSFLAREAGTWTTLAIDLTHGVFYRPVASPDGFGGTRYFPLHFVLHAVAMKAGMPPVFAGQLLAVLSVCAAAAGVFFLVRHLGASPVLAFAGVAAVLVSQVTQGALVSIRADALPAALNVLGIAVCAASGPRRRQTLTASALFVLAFSAKATAVYGVIAGVVWLLGVERRRDAAILAGTTIVGMALTLLAMDLFSSGRAFDVLWAGSTTGVTLMAFVRAPLLFAQLARQVPETLVFIQLGIAAALAMAVGDRSICRLPVAFFGATLVVSIPIFAFEGTNTNHLIDIHIASVVAIVGYIASQIDLDAAFSSAALGIAILGASLSLATGLTSRSTIFRYGGTVDEAVALIPDRDRPILAENPLVPIAAGQRPYLLDSFMFRMMNERNASFGAPLFQGIREQRFSAIVLDRDPHQEPGRMMYRDVFFGGSFLEDLDRYYQQVGQLGQRTVFVPRAR